MEGPFEKMEREGEPKAPEPTKEAAPKQEEQNLPKLSPQELRIYNRMADHMDMFVSLPRPKYGLPAHTNTHFPA